MIETPAIKAKSSIFKSQQAGVAALFVTIATLLSTVLGLVRDKVMAHYFGASLEMDLYNYGFTIPDYLQNVLIMGVTSSSFIPIFADYIANNGSKDANRMASSFLNITLLVFTVVCILTGIFMPQITDIWLANDMPAAEKDSIVFISRLFLISQIAFALSKILSGILQTHKHFTAYALALLVYNPSIILGIFLFHESYGVYSAAYGAVLGACLVVVVNLFDLRGTHFKFSFSMDWRSPGIKSVFLLAIPTLLNMALLNSMFVIYSKISIDLPDGSYSIFRYAYNFESFPVSIFGISFVTAIFPFLAENISTKNFSNFNYNIQNSIRQILYLTLPAGIGMALLSKEIIGLVLGGGKFGPTEVQLTSAILFYYALVVPLESLWYLFARAFYATQDTWTPFWFRFIGTAINLVLSYVLAQTIGPAAFSLGLLVAFAIQVVLFIFGLKKKIPEFDLQHALSASYKLIGCAVAMGLVVAVLNQYLNQAEFLIHRTDRIQFLIRTAAGMGVGSMVYIGLTILFKCADFTVFQRVMGRITKK